MIMKKKIIIDTDPGVDDAMAYQLAIASPELDVLGLTTVFGNVDLERTTINALRLVDLSGRKDIAVARGAANPISGRFHGGAAFVHGADGQGNTWAPESSLDLHPLSASDFIVSKILEFPGEVTLLPIGPLTNIALAIKSNPEIIPLTKGVVMMGGNAFCPGNATPAAEANVFSDPHAADLVMGANWPVTMVGIDVSHQVLMTDEILGQLASLPGTFNRYIASIIPFYRDFYARVNQIEGIFVHDSTALMYVLEPENFKTARYPVKVETTDSISKGKTWPAIKLPVDPNRTSFQPWRDRPAINVCTEVDGHRIIHSIVSRISDNIA